MGGVEWEGLRGRDQQIDGSREGVEWEGWYVQGQKGGVQRKANKEMSQ